tara:strand:- start:12340 stop:13200 length:861 start_codon:yes stop_codon:yes gene_type:complete
MFRKREDFKVESIGIVCLQQGGQRIRRPSSRLMASAILSLLSIVSCTRFSGSETEDLQTLISAGLLLEPSGDCAFIYGPAANDFRVEIRPIPPAGCNQNFFFGADYQAYVAKERNRLYPVESLLQQTAPGSCTATIASVQNYIANPASNPLLISSTQLSQLVRFDIVNGVLEGTGRTVGALQSIGFSAPDASAETSVARMATLLEFEREVHIVLSVLFAQAAGEPACATAIAPTLNALKPGWVGDQVADTIYGSSGPASADPVLFLTRCVYGSANSGSPDFCATLQ